MCKKASPLGVTPHGVGRCPQGRGDRSVRGEPPLGGGGVLLWNLFHSVLDFTEAPLSQAYGLPAQHKARPTGALKGSLYTKGSLNV